jgi:hypothetical protein
MQVKDDDGRRRHGHAMRERPAWLRLAAAARRAAVGIAAALASVAAAAEPGFPVELRQVVVDHFQTRLESEQCARHFHFEGALVVNWRNDGATAKVEVVFFVRYVSDGALYRDSSLTAYCLGGHRGTGFFERSKFYRTAAQVYDLSQWDAGWHVDRVALQP